MDWMLQKHGAKHVYRLPEGLPELCSDISREVLREQPKNIYQHIADYVDALLTTRENAKIAVRFVNNVLHDGEEFLNGLEKRGLKNEEILAAARKIETEKKNS